MIIPLPEEATQRMKDAETAAIQTYERLNRESKSNLVEVFFEEQFNQENLLRLKCVMLNFAINPSENFTREEARLVLSLLPNDPKYLCTIDRAFLYYVLFIGQQAWKEQREET